MRSPKEDKQLNERRIKGINGRFEDIDERIGGIDRRVKGFDRRVKKTQSYKNRIIRSLYIDKYKLLFYIIINIQCYQSHTLQFFLCKYNLYLLNWNKFASYVIIVFDYKNKL